MEVRIGPKSYRSSLPIGYISGTIVDKLDAAEIGQMGNQIFNFNMRLRHLPDGSSEYIRAFFLNGHLRFKRYNFLDVAIYKLAHLFQKSPYNG